MHRQFRCLVLLTSVLSALTLLGQCVPSSAQQNPIPPAPPAPAAPPQPAPTPLPQAPPAATGNSSAPIPTGKAPHRLNVQLHLGDGKRMWRPTRRQIGVAYAPGGSDQSAPGTFQFTVDRAKLRKYLTAIAPYVRSAPKEAQVVVASPSASDMGEQAVPAKIIPEKDGVALDIDQAVDLVQKTVQQNPATLHLVLPLKRKSPHLTAAKLQGIDSRIGYFVTRFNPHDVGRTQTVRLAISIIDGTIVPPGQVFSVNNTVGERTAERGFGMGHVFVDGKMQKQLGGGMCQVATTLFNAAMLADLEIVQRFQHVRTVPYVAPGRDATVYWGQKDFKIKNNTSAPLYISYKTTYSHAIVSLYGKATPGRKVKLISHWERLAERHFKGQFYRVVYEPGGVKHKDKTYYSNYKWTPALDFSH